MTGPAQDRGQAPAATTAATAEERIERLIADQPRFHAWPDGRSANWAVAPDVLRFLAEQLGPGMATLETGAGQTTAAFAIAGTTHVAITPDGEQIGKVRAYLDGLGLAGEVAFIQASSDAALPAGAGIPERLDLVLIDGAHRFPFPIIDWHYTEARIPVGGIVVVDDHRMPSVRVLYDFLRGESDWELVREFPVTAFFRRAAKRENLLDWVDQDINKPHLDRVTETVVIDPPGGPDAPDAAAGDRGTEIELRAARLQLKNLAQELRAAERSLRNTESTLRSTESTLRRTRGELWRIRRSRAWRLYRALRAAPALPRKLYRRLRQRDGTP